MGKLLDSSSSSVNNGLITQVSTQLVFQRRCLNTEVSTVAVNALVVSPETWQYNRRQACDISRNYSRSRLKRDPRKEPDADVQRINSVICSFLSACGDSFSS